MTPAKPSGRDEAVVSIVTDRYVRDNKGSTVADIAGALGWPESRVRTVLRGDNGFMPRELASSRESRQSYSTNYKGFEAGVHLVTVYYPSLRHLANTVKLLTLLVPTPEKP